MASRQDDNQVRSDGPAVESYFVRANDPASPRAFWLKATALTTVAGRATCSAWVACFAEDKGAARIDLPRRQCAFSDPSRLTIGAVDWTLTEDSGTSEGAIGDFRWAVHWRADRDYGPLCLFPTRRLLSAPLPKSKLVTPTPRAQFWGRVQWRDRRWDIDGWPGMQGHNWGREHAHRYAWGQCLFDEGMCEAFSAKVKLGPARSPTLSALVAVVGGRTYRFDRLVDRWRQSAVIGRYDWFLGLSGRSGRAELTLRASPEQMVALAYDNPSGTRAYCLNSKLAEARLRVWPVDDQPFALHSLWGGALEFLRAEPDPVCGEVV
jgi:hypothetical protein